MTESVSPFVHGRCLMPQQQQQQNMWVYVTFYGLHTSTIFSISLDTFRAANLS